MYTFKKLGRTMVERLTCGHISVKRCFCKNVKAPIIKCGLSPIKMAQTNHQTMMYLGAVINSE